VESAEAMRLRGGANRGGGGFGKVAPRPREGVAPEGK